jgi:hypothetical protein
MTTPNKPAVRPSGEPPLNPEEQGYHEQAVENYAVERYLLNEMTDEEKLRFEQHYFQCTACMKEVESGQTFVKSIGPPSWTFRLREFFSSCKKWQAAVLYPLTAALVGMVAFQNVFLIPRLQAQLAAVFPTTIVTAHQGERGGSSSDKKGEVVRTGYITVDFDLPPLTDYPYYRVNVVNALNPKHMLFSEIIPAPASSGSPLAFTVSKSVLGRGQYNSEIFGLRSENTTSGTPLQPNYFNVQ